MGLFLALAPFPKNGVKFECLRDPTVPVQPLPSPAVLTLPSKCFLRHFFTPDRKWSLPAATRSRGASTDLPYGDEEQGVGTGSFWVGMEQEQEADVAPGGKGTAEARKALPLGTGVLSEARSKT